ncbi:amino acid permease [Micrococcales bacterium 31B]|nr:amino acid permease [Micrococcales bacterium 31B]
MLHPPERSRTKPQTSQWRWATLLEPRSNPVTDQLNAAQSVLDAEQEGYHKGLKNRQVQMIAIGGAIGTGLFLGAGKRLHDAGPALFVIYLVCGIFVFFILRALGELVLHRPSSGSFVSYAREFYGEKSAYVAGWMYFVNWAATGIVDATAAATYLHFWSTFESTPMWVLALISLVVVLCANLISVKIFGELEFWFALVKVVAILAFLTVALIVLGGRFDLDGATTGLSVITDNGGLFPNGVLPALVLTSGVVFAYASVELVGTAAGETENPEKIMPRAINSVIVRIAVFYVGSTILLSLLLPYTEYQAGESPFVTFFDKLGVSWTANVMNFVVLTAALSSLNAGLYSTGRILRSMSIAGSAPASMQKMSKGGVPYPGILLTAGIGLLGVGLNYLLPEGAFETALGFASLGIISTWAFIIVCQMKLMQLAKQGKVKRPDFRMPGAPVTSWLTLVFLAAVLVLLFMDGTSGLWTLGAVPVIGVLLIIGWYLQRDRIRAIAEARAGYTGAVPTVANRPMADPLAPFDKHRHKQDPSDGNNPGSGES